MTHTLGACDGVKPGHQCQVSSTFDPFLKADVHKLAIMLVSNSILPILNYTIEV